MKTRRQKVFAIIIACLLCASFFVVPVSAENIYDVSFFAPEATAENYYFRIAGGAASNSSNLDDTPWTSLQPAVSSMYYPDAGYSIYDFNMISNQSLTSVWIGNSTFGDIGRYQVSDTVWMDPGSFILGSDRDNFGVYNMRFSLRSVTSSGVGKVIASTDWQSISIGTEGIRQVLIEYPRMSFNFRESVSATGLVLCLDFSVSAMDVNEKMILITPSAFSMHYAVGSGPNVPIYPAPDQGNIGQMESAEEELMQGGQAGIDAGADTFRDFGDAFNSHPNLSRCFVKISDMFVRLSGLPQMNTLVHISLSLGLFASLLGLAGSIVSAADRKAGREAAAAARASKSK